MSDEVTKIPARDHKELSLALKCHACDAWTERDLGPRGSELPDKATCTSCGSETDLALPECVDAQGALDGCPACGYHTLCIQKDVNQKLGVILVVVTFGALLFAGLSIPQLLIGLVLLAGLDWLLMAALVKRFLICYRCKAQFRGFPPGPRCRPFDLATWEAHDSPASTSD
ncbi:MAG: hypothetical protein P8N09_12505 [Planctomycetota bacterium]|jgi:hypothetical protein|nr:hypothetical protein [Planctomycetota bacterium]